jgi:uncharacterized membrane protein (UPF0127 family)
LQQSPAPIATRTVAVAVAVGLALAGTARGASSAAQVVIRTAAGGAIAVQVEVAATPPQRERGLMYRKELARGHGMLFLFPREADHAFWMRNTPLALDIIFIGGDRRIVGIQANTVPYSERRLRAGRPSRYVLEVSAGFCAAEGVGVGDCVELQGIAGVEGGSGPCAGSDRGAASGAGPR